MAGWGEPTIDAVGEIGRLALHARRCGLLLRVGDVSAPTRALIELAGLSGVLGVEVGRQPE